MYIPVLFSDIAASGINLSGVLQTSVDDGRIIIENASLEDLEDYVCDGGCESCPIRDIKCSNDCEHCPCKYDCEGSKTRF